MARTIRARKSTSSTTLGLGRGRYGSGRGLRSFPALGASFLLLLAGPALSENAVTTLLAAVPATGASSSFGMAPGATSADYFILQVTYPAGVTTKLQASCDASTWADQATWASGSSASGAIVSAPNIGGCLYRMNVTTYTGVTAYGGTIGLNDVTFSGTYSGAAASSFTVEVTANGTPDVVRWRKGSGAWTTGVNLTGSAQLMSDGISFTAAATTGHTIGDTWTYTLGGVSAVVTASGSAVVRTQ